MPPITLIEIQGTIQSIVYRSQEGYTVLKLGLSENNPLNRSSIIATGHIPYAISPDVSVKIAGYLEQTAKYGEQLKIETFELVIDRSMSGMEKYLGSGMVFGIGPATARKILDTFGEDTFNVLDSEPSRLLEIPRLGEATIAKISESWTNHRLQVQQFAPLMDLGLTVSQAKKAIELWGREAKRFILDNPYNMIELPGIGFVKADIVALKNGMKPEHPDRIFAGLKHVLREATQEGHCFLPALELFQQAKFLLQIDPDIISQQLIEAKSNPAYDDFTCIQGKWYLKEIYEQERGVEHIISTMGKLSDARFQAIDIPPDSILSIEQQAGIFKSLQSQFSVITGLPGTGKTTMVRELLGIARKKIQSVRLCAPTGKAAKRLSESTGYQASTIHRLLGLGKDEFEDAANTLDDVGLVVVDETSMIDIRLAFKLLSKVNMHKTKVIFIGDFNQLPSVGPGQVLRDIIQSNACPVTRLTKIFRQAEGSPVITLAHAIYRGDVEVPKDSVGEDEQMVGVVIQEEINDLMEKVCEAVAYEKMNEQEVQVLVPFKKKGLLSSTFLNARLQPILNPSALEILTPKLGKFYLNDRVIQTANNYDLGVFNGEVGIVVGVMDGEKKYLSVKFDDEKTVAYPLDDLKQLELAYALTIHKSQGSEFDTVILAIHSSHFIILRRELIYTAITRAKRRLILCTNRKAYKIAVANEKNSERFTTLFKKEGS